MATGELHSVRELIEFTVDELWSEKIVWKGSGSDEEGFINNKKIIEISSDFYRPAEVELLVGDASKAKKDLKWKPKYNFKSLIREMIHFELNK